jgi:hypothetical protein
MKVFGLQGSLYRFARAASCVLAETSDTAAERRDALARFERACHDGLTTTPAGPRRGDCARQSVSLACAARAEEPATAPGAAEELAVRAGAGRGAAAARLPDVGPRQDRAAGQDRRVRRLRFHRRPDHPLAGGARRGRACANPAAQASDPPLDRKTPPRPAPPSGSKPDRPGGLVQIDTVFVTLAPGRAIKHFTAYDPAASGPSARPLAEPPRRPRAWRSTHPRQLPAPRQPPRPHGALAGQTPAAYLAARQAAEIQPSHMS